MGITCAVKNCTSSFRKGGIRFFRLPSVQSGPNSEYHKLKLKQRKLWFLAMKLQPVSSKKTVGLRICAKHFVHGCPASYDDENNVDWIPSLEMGYPKPTFPKGNDLKSRRSRIKNEDVLRESQINIAPFDSQETQADTSEPEPPDSIEFPASPINVNNMDTVASIHDSESNTQQLWNDSCRSTSKNDSLVDCGVQSDFEINKTEQFVQTDMTLKYITALELEVLAQSSRVAELREENAKLKEELEKLSWSESTFKDDPKQFTYYTGLPTLAMFVVILQLINSSLDNVHVPKCSNFQKLILTCMKLRHNTSFKGLGYRFRIDARDASYIFKNVIVILYEIFPFVVHWPERESLRRRVPECFKKVYGKKVAVIIDCFEIGCEKPATLRARAQTYSSYKGKNTAKYLIGITPHGFISHISDGYGGRVSDKHITENCGILDNLLPGDIVLADRGFTVYEMVAMKYASLNIPAFTQGAKQLHPIEIERTRKIAKVRIHVERVIGLLRNKYTILTHRVPVHFFKERHNDKVLFDMIVRVCCIFINLCDPIVPLKERKIRKKCSRILNL